jgi:hypothetical protein
MPIDFAGKFGWRASMAGGSGRVFLLVVQSACQVLQFSDRLVHVSRDATVSDPALRVRKSFEDGVPGGRVADGVDRLDGDVGGSGIEMSAQFGLHLVRGAP